VKRHIRDFWFGYVLAAYIIVGIVTFGYGAHASFKSDLAIHNACLITEQKTTFDGHCNDSRPMGAYSAMVGVGEGVAWPLYLSWVYFDSQDKEQAS
jgi:hypothetical protein